MKRTLINKLIFLGIFILVSLILEAYYFIVQYNQLFPSYFLYDFCIILILGCLTFICGKYKGQIVVSTIIWIVHVILITANMALTKANGDIFSWEMFALIIDAAEATTGAGAGVFIKLDPLFILVPIVGLGLASMILIYKRKIIKEGMYVYKKYDYLKTLGCSGLVIALCMTCNLITVATLNNQNSAYKIFSDEYLYDSQFIKQEALRKFGNFGFYYINAKSNIKRNFDDKEEKITTLRTYIEDGEKIDTTTAYTGVSKGNNVICILFETGEWFGINKDITPNLFSLMYENELQDSSGNTIDGGILLTNYHSKSQTNISEAQALFGSYPLNGILNYNYAENYFSFTLPNMFKQNYPNAQVNSYHSNNGEYYNRYESHVRYGFDKHYAADELQLGTASSSTWIRMDSELFEKSLVTTDKLESAIPENHEEPFMSYIASFSSHGPYTGRDYLSENIEHVKNTIKEPFNTLIGHEIDLENEIYGNEVTTYLAAVYDFDLGIGKLIDELKKQNELDNTTILIFSDHYAYYSNLSATTKGYSADASTFPEIYNVPALIFDSKLKAKMKENIANDKNIKMLNYYGKNILTYDKFCANIDFVPTLMDFLGFDYNPHNYTGVNILSDEETFILSRYGGMFNDKFYTSDGKNIDNLPLEYYYYQEEESAGVSIDDIEEISGMSIEEYVNLKNEIDNFYKSASDFLIKQDYLDMIYRNDYYGKIKL